MVNLHSYHLVRKKVKNPTEDAGQNTRTANELASTKAMQN